MHDYSAQALDAPAAESWVDCKKTGNVWQQKGRSLGVIVVLAGGLSPERQVSLVSGESICRALRSLGHRAVLGDMFLICLATALFMAMPEARCPDPV